MPTFPIREGEAYAEGCNARNIGVLLAQNPYGGDEANLNATVEQWQGWRNGWQDTDSDARRERKEGDTP